MEQVNQKENVFYQRTKLPTKDINDINANELSISYFDLPNNVGVLYYSNQSDPDKYQQDIRINRLLPDYNYKLLIDEDFDVLNSYDPLPKKKLEMLNTLINKEHVNIKGYKPTIDEYDEVFHALEQLSHIFGGERSASFFSKIGIPAINLEDGILILDKEFKNYKLNLVVSFDKKDLFSETFKNDILKDKIDINKISLNLKLIEIFKNNILLFKAIQQNKELLDCVLNVSKDSCNEEFLKEDLKNIINIVQKIRDYKSFLSNDFSYSSSKNKIKFPKNIEELTSLTNSDEDLEGSNKATNKFIREEDGQVFVIKENPDNITANKSEYEALQIYKAFGARVPENHLIEEDGRAIIAMEFIDCETIYSINKAGEYFETEQLMLIRKEVEKNFAIDVLIGNFDAGTLHSNNVIISKNDKKLYKIDPGAALEFDYKGIKKGSSKAALNFIKWDNDVVRDFSIWRDNLGFKDSSSALASYSGVTNKEILEQLHNAKNNMDKVKKVASPKNYKIINARLEKGLKHFTKLCDFENKLHKENNSLEKRNVFRQLNKFILNDLKNKFLNLTNNKKQNTLFEDEKSFLNYVSLRNNKNKL